MNRIGRNYLDIYSIHSCAVCTGACLCRCRCHRRRHYVCTEIRVCEMMNATPTKFKLKYLIYTEKLHVLSIGWHGDTSRDASDVLKCSPFASNKSVTTSNGRVGKDEKEKKKNISQLYASMCISGFGCSANGRWRLPVCAREAKRRARKF